MDEPFESAKLLLAEAQENISEFDKAASRFIHPNNGTAFVEFDPQSGHHLLKVRFKTDMPNLLTMRAKNVFGNLRDALDHALFASASLTLGKEPRRCKFPFGDTPVAVEAEIMEGRCDDLHPEILKLVIAAAPYEAGNRTLWAMNKIRNRNTHRVLKPNVVASNSFNVGNGLASFEVIPSEAEWRSTRRELIYARLRLNPGADFEVGPNLAVSLDRAFGFDRRTAVEVFDETLKNRL